MNITWPLFWCLTPECQAALMQYQWDTYGYRLVIPALPHFEVTYPSLDEIDKTMRQKPHGMKRVT